MSKRITCNYQLSEELLSEYVQQLRHSSRPLYAMLTVLLFGLGLAQQVGAVGGIWSPGVWYLLGGILLFTMIIYTDKVMTKRMASRYRTRFGGVDVPVQVSLGSRIDSTINGVERHFMYGGIMRLTETEHLLVVNYQTDAVLLAKDGFPEGVTLAEVKELIGRHIAIDKGEKDRRRRVEERADERKRIEREKKRKAKRKGTALEAAPEDATAQDSVPKEDAAASESEKADAASSEQDA
jgi:hypothetical protein